VLFELERHTHACTAASRARFEHPVQSLGASRLSCRPSACAVFGAVCAGRQDAVAARHRCLGQPVGGLPAGRLPRAGPPLWKTSDRARLSAAKVRTFHAYARRLILERLNALAPGAPHSSRCCCSITFSSTCTPHRDVHACAPHLQAQLALRRHVRERSTTTVRFIAR
jgi:hypothetical protein